MAPPLHVTRLSRGLYWVATAVLALLPPVVGLALWQGFADPAAVAARFAGLPPATSVTPATALAAVAIGALTLPVLWALLVQMRALFARYAAGEVLTAACAGHIRRIGQLLVGLAALGVVVPTLQMLVLTFANPAGQTVLSIGITGEAAGVALAGGLLTLIGWAMAAAVREIEAFV